MFQQIIVLLTQNRFIFFEALVICTLVDKNTVAMGQGYFKNNVKVVTATFSVAFKIYSKPLL